MNNKIPKYLRDIFKSIEYPVRLPDGEVCESSSAEKRSEKIKAVKCAVSSGSLSREEAKRIITTIKKDKV